LDKFFDFEGYKIYYHSNGEAKKGKVFIVHGIGEHIGRYKRIESILVNDGFMVEGVDLIGHGKTSGKRGDIPSFDFLFKVFDEAIKIQPNENVYLLGHSLGGLIGVRYLEEREKLFKKQLYQVASFILIKVLCPKFFYLYRNFTENLSLIYSQ